MNYFYVENDQQKGPVGVDELLALPLLPTTMIWYEGLDTWTLAGRIKEFEPHFKKSTPPPIPKEEKEKPPAFEKSKKTTNTQVEENKSGRKMSIGILFVAVATLIFLIVYSLNKPAVVIEDDTSLLNDSGQNNESTGNETAVYQQPAQHSHQLTEEEMRQDLFVEESAKPKTYLSVNGKYHVNLLSNTVIEGRVFNSASVAGFENVQLTARFYSKTDVLLGEDSFLVMEFVPSGESVAFKHKIQGWWDNVDHWTLSVDAAQPYGDGLH